MKTLNLNKPAIHFVDSYLLNPTNPLTVNVIGAGGTGSHVLGGLGRMNRVLKALDHAGLAVRLWDDDLVTEFNPGRQDFSESEIGYAKADVLIKRCNRKYGTDWKAIPEKFTDENPFLNDKRKEANIYITCVDNVATRFEVNELLKTIQYNYLNETLKPMYWIDFGNSRDSGQVILSTIGEILQPTSKIYNPVGILPSIVEEYTDLLLKSEEEDDTPSCSMAESLEEQDLYINSTLAQMGCNLLYNMMRTVITKYRGFFIDLKNYQTRPIKIRI